MMKRIVFILLSIPLLGAAQFNSDSLWSVWENQANDELERMNALSTMVFNFKDINPDSAIKLANILIDVANEKNIPKYLIKGYNNKGIAHMNLGSYEDAIGLFEKTIELAKIEGDSSGIASATANIGSVYSYQGLFSLGLRYWKSALQFVDINKSPLTYANITGNMSQIHGLQENYKKTINGYKKGLSIYKNQNNNDTALEIGNIGFAYAKLGQYKMALAYLYRSAELATIKKQPYYRANAYRSIAETYMFLEQYDSALVYLNRTLDFDLDGLTETSCLILLGRVSNSKKAFKSGVGFCLNALKLAGKFGLTKEKRDACECLYNGYKNMDNLGSTLVYLERMNRLNDSLNIDEASKLLQQMAYEKKIITDSLKRDDIERKATLKEQEIEEAKSRKNRIQYSLVIIVVLLLATVIAVATKFSISPRVASGLIFIFFILTFEFLLVVLDPWVDSISNGEVGWKIGINTAIALVLFGVHQVSEKRLKNALIKTG